MPLPEEVEEPLPDILEPESAAGRRPIDLSGARAVVNEDLEAGVAAVGLHADRPPSRLPRDPVLDGVLHHRLEEERRDERVADRVVHVEGNREAVLEAGPLDLEVPAAEVDLLGERDERRGVGVEGDAEDLSEPDQRGDGEGRVGADQREDRVQGVEEEMGVDLRP